MVEDLGEGPLVGDHLRVDLGLLQETASALGQLKSEFEHSGDIADDQGASVGAGDLRDALHDFATNWKAHRNGIVGGINAVSQMAQSGHDGYIEVDEKLAKALSTSSETG
jgi:hypothetical protein